MSTMVRALGAAGMGPLSRERHSVNDAVVNGDMVMSAPTRQTNGHFRVSDMWVQDPRCQLNNHHSVALELDA